MSVINRIPTANETPDTANGIAGDIAVTTPSNTGHASTTSTFGGGSGQVDKSCRWFTFQNLIPGIRTSVKLKVTHTSSGDDVSDPPFSGGNTNQFLLEYSLNGGGGWTPIVNRIDFESSQGPTVAEVTLPLTQDLTQVQVRDLIRAGGNLSVDPVSATATITDIKVEVTVADTSTFLD
jgi:hypothetical protein